MDSIIAPLLPDMRKNTVLSEGVKKALNETLATGATGRRLREFKPWRQDGTILYSKDHTQTGRIEPSNDLREAWSGKIVAQFNDFDEVERAAEGATGLPLLEIYNPVLQPWSGEVVAVSEFYEVATDLAKELMYAKILGWSAVATIVLSFYGCLYAIVRRGSQTIERHVSELTAALETNKALSLRVREAAQRAAAQNERHLRSIGADLHDGPAQLIALAALHMETDALLNGSSLQERMELVSSVRQSLDDSMREIRSISAGLILPNIEDAQLDEVVALAARAHEKRTTTTVQLEQEGGNDRDLPAAIKICSFRFVQEALSNAFRHAGGVGQHVRLRCNEGRVLLEVSDSGPGFEPGTVHRNGLGLAGLRDRVESLGGLFKIETSPQGTTLSMVLNEGARRDDSHHDCHC